MRSKTPNRVTPPPNLRHFELRLSVLKAVATRYNIRSQLHILFCKFLKISSICWTTMSKNRRSATFFKFRSRTPVYRSWRTWHRAPRENHNGFKSDRATWARWSWNQSVWGFERAAKSKKQTRNFEVFCLLWGDSEGKRQIFCSPEENSWLLQVMFEDSCLTTCVIRHCRWQHRSAVYSTYESASSLSFY